MVAPVVPFVLGDIGWLMAGIASYFLGKEAVDAVDALDQPTEDQTPQKDPDKGLLPVPTPPYTRLENIRKDHDQDTSCRPDHEVAAFLRRAFPDLTAPHTPESLLALVHLCGRTAEAEGYPGRTCLFYWSVLGLLRDPAFHRNDLVKEYLEIRYLSPRHKLEHLVMYLNHYLRNEHLTKLTDVWERRVHSPQETR